MAVYVLAKNKKRLMPCSEKRARLLLERGRARIDKTYPFTIRLTDRVDGATQPLALKIDPGSKKTGFAIVRQTAEEPVVVNLFELEHRGQNISETLKTRKGYRKRRRSVNLRYRAPRFNNRRKPAGWLAPSLRHRIQTTMSWVERIIKLAPITEIVEELVRFDMQKIQNPEISGIEYQNGTLAGFEIREYLLAKFGHQCVYCDTQVGPFNLDHVQPRSKNGSNRVSNLVLACIPCNEAKDDQSIHQFLNHDPIRVAKILKHAKAPLRDAAAVNSTRYALLGALNSINLPVSVGTGGRTKFNRKRYGVPKTHALDAACVGIMDDIPKLKNWNILTLEIAAKGRGAYQRTRVRSGFPNGYLPRIKRHFGFQTGDMVFADVPRGKHGGKHTGRVAVRSSGSFNIQTANGTLQGIRWKHCRTLQRADGYRYNLRKALFLLGLNAKVSAA